MRFEVKKFDFIVEAQEAGQRLDRYLSKNIEEYSRSAIQTIIREGKVTINDRVGKSNYRLKQEINFSFSITSIQTTAYS